MDFYHSRSLLAILSFYGNFSPTATVYSSKWYRNVTMSSGSFLRFAQMTSDTRSTSFCMETLIAQVWVFEPTYRNPIDFCSRMFQNRTNMFSRSKFHQELDFEEQSTFYRQGKSQNERVPKSTDGTVLSGRFSKYAWLPVATGSNGTRWIDRLILTSSSMVHTPTFLLHL